MQGRKKRNTFYWGMLALLTASVGGCAVERPPAPPTKAQLLFDTCVKPEYPRDAVRRESSGTVTLMFYVEPNGRVSDTRIAKSTGDVMLDEAALKSLKTCRFKPATENGKPVGQWAPVQYVWSLEDSHGIPVRP